MTEPAGPVGAVEYSEQPRSYVETLLVVAVLAVGFGIDLSFDVGGAITHLPGWLLATVLVAGVDALLVASVRATRRLVVTAAEVWVGEEMIRRADIAGVVPAGTWDVADMAVLGWPSGKQGRSRSLALRLTGGRDVLVPARDPQRLADVLDVGEAAVREPPIIRDATEADLPLLAEIDLRAEVVFGLAGFQLPDLAFELPEDAVAVFVAGTPPVGFAVLTEADGLAHLAEIGVLPSVMRTGLGTRLLEHACAWALAAGYDAVTLCTFAEVPWNGPWYAARGFVEIESSAGLAAVRERERELGLDAAGRRVVMRRDLAG